MHLRSYRILQMSLHGGPQIFLKFCTQSYISKTNLPRKFQLPDRYGCRDMNTLRFETKLHFAKFEKRKNAITFEILLGNLQFFLNSSIFNSLLNGTNMIAQIQSHFKIFSFKWFFTLPLFARELPELLNKVQVRISHMGTLGHILTHIQNLWWPYFSFLNEMKSKKLQNLDSHSSVKIAMKIKTL